MRRIDSTPVSYSRLTHGHARSAAARAFTRIGINPARPDQNFDCAPGSTREHVLTNFQYQRQQRSLVARFAIAFILLFIFLVVLLFGSLHFDICRDSARHSMPFPDIFSESAPVFSIIAQEFGVLIRRISIASEGILLSSAIFSITVGSEYGRVAREVAMREFERFGEQYAPVQVHKTPAYIREFCNITLTVGTTRSMNSSWFRAIPHTCRAVDSKTPVLLDIPAGVPVNVDAYGGIVVILFQDQPFQPLQGNPFVNPATKPLILQVDRRLRDLFRNTSVVVTVPMVSAAPIEVQTVVYMPAVNPGPTFEALTYIYADLNANSDSNDHWGALVLLEQTMRSVQHNVKARDHTAFVLGVAGSFGFLVRQGVIKNVQDAIALTACGLPNGIDALYTSKTALSNTSNPANNLATVMGAQQTSLTGSALLSGHALWHVTSWSPFRKTIREATVTGGIAGMEVAPAVHYPQWSTIGISVPTLIAQLKTVLWMLDVAASSPTGISGIFV